jgi:hypothetical protein
MAGNGRLRELGEPTVAVCDLTLRDRHEFFLDRARDRPWFATTNRQPVD